MYNPQSQIYVIIDIAHLMHEITPPTIQADKQPLIMLDQCHPK